MKTIRYLILLLALGSIIGFISCGDDDDDNDDDTMMMTLEEEQLLLLAKDWSVTSITVDGVDITANFGGLVLSITDNRQFSTSGGDFAPVWPSSGSFVFGSNVNTLERSDGITMTISAITDTNVTFNFTFSPPDGRTDGIFGQYVCQFTAQ
ncbi:MAG TPA: hypothetical protein ACFCUD_14800 [Cyclobacteriaceae bacterium]